MSYSALTDLGTKPICPNCTKEIVPGDKVVLVLETTVSNVRDYNKENEMPEDNVTVDLDWGRQVAFHETCLSVNWGEQL